MGNIIKIRTIEQQAIDNLKAIVNCKDETIDLEPTFEETAQVLLDYINDLQEENEKLKKQYKKEELKLFHDNEILQTRIDKAIEYIDYSTINPEDLTLYDNMTKEEYLMLKKILKGEE